MRKFWILWSPSGNTPPQHIHTDYNAAYAAACVMAAKHRKPFYIMEAKAVMTAEVVVTKTNLI